MTGGRNETPARGQAQPGQGNRYAEAAGISKVTQAEGRAKRCGVILATLDEIDEAISVFQERCEGDGAFQMMAAHHIPDRPDNVTPIYRPVTVPGDAWQHLEAIRGLAWAVRKLAEEIGGGT